jgi:hypothetical protein
MTDLSVATTGWTVELLEVPAETDTGTLITRQKLLGAFTTLHRGAFPGSRNRILRAAWRREGMAPVLT